MKLKIIKVANDIDPMSVSVAIDRLLSECSDKIDYIHGFGGKIEDWNDNDFEEFDDDESYTMIIKMRQRK